jgi:hypothetical protein
MIRLLSIVALFAAPVIADETPAKDEKICKRITETGTRVGGARVCKSAEQWKQLEDDAKDTTRRLQKNRGATKGG